MTQSYFHSQIRCSSSHFLFLHRLSSDAFSPPQAVFLLFLKVFHLLGMEDLRWPLTFSNHSIKSPRLSESVAKIQNQTHKWFNKNILTRSSLDFSFRVTLSHLQLVVFLHFRCFGRKLIPTLKIINQLINVFWMQHFPAEYIKFLLFWEFIRQKQYICQDGSIDYQENGQYFYNYWCFFCVWLSIRSIKLKIQTIILHKSKDIVWKYYFC